MTLNELGAMLLEARTRHNLSAENMADRLKLPVSTIRAIEDGNLKELPHPAYARGFIKAYASMVGIPADLVHEALAVLVEEETPPTPIVTRSSRMASFSPPRIDGASVLRLLGLLVMMAIAAAVFWFREPLITQAVELWHSVTGQQTDSQAPAALPVSESTVDTNALHNEAAPEASSTAIDQHTPAINATEDAMGEPEANETTSVQAESSAATTGSQTTADAGQASVDMAQHNATVPGSTSGSAQELRPTVTAESHKLVINAVDTCWVMVRPDSAKSTEFSLRKGEGATFTFNKTLTLRLGNAGGVRLVYDGQPMDAPGARGQAKTLTFPPKS